MGATDTINGHLREAISGRSPVANFAAASRGFVGLGESFEVGHQTPPRLEATVFYLGAAMMSAMSQPGEGVDQDDIYDAAAAGANLLAALGQNTPADLEERKYTIIVSIERIEAFLTKHLETTANAVGNSARSLH